MKKIMLAILIAFSFLSPLAHAADKPQSKKSRAIITHYAVHTLTGGLVFIPMGVSGGAGIITGAVVTHVLGPKKPFHNLWEFFVA